MSSDWGRCGNYGVVGWETEEAAYRACGPDLMRFACVLVGFSDAEDLVSTTLSSLLQSDRWRTSDDMRTYAMGALARQASMHHRSFGRRRLRETRSASAVSVGEPTLSDPAIWNAVKALPLRQRAVIFLAYWEDQSVAAIASTLGISSGSVKRHLSRARHSLRQALDGY